MTGILGQLKWESLKKRRKDNRLILLYKGLKGEASVPTDDLIPKTRHCRNQHSMAFQTPIASIDVYKGASSPRLSGIGMPSPILWSHPLKMQRIVLLSSLLWCELGTNSLITGPGEWLSFRRFPIKLSWSWCSIFWPPVPSHGMFPGVSSYEMEADPPRFLQIIWKMHAFWWLTDVI